MMDDRWHPNPGVYHVGGQLSRPKLKPSQFTNTAVSPRLAFAPGDSRCRGQLMEIGKSIISEAIVE